MRDLRIGVIGYGNMGTSYAKWLVEGKVPGAVLSSVCDAAPAKRAAAKEALPASIAIFQNTDQNESDWKRFPLNGKISKIEKTSDLSGKLEHAFQIQDLGAATWLGGAPILPAPARAASLSCRSTAISSRSLPGTAFPSSCSMN